MHLLLTLIFCFLFGRVSCVAQSPNANHSLHIVFFKKWNEGTSTIYQRGSLVPRLFLYGRGEKGDGRKAHRGRVWEPNYQRGSLVPRPFPYGRDEKGDGRKGLVNNLTPMRIHGCIPAVSVDEGKCKCQVGVSRE